MINWNDKISRFETGNVEIGNIWSEGNNLSLIVNDLCELSKDFIFDAIATIETKGIIFAAPIAAQLSKPLLIFRKKDKIFYTKEKFSVYFQNWRGIQDGIEIEKSILSNSFSILVIDDLVDKKSSYSAVHHIIKSTSSTIVGFISFANLSGSNDIDGIKMKSLIQTPENYL